MIRNGKVHMTPRESAAYLGRDGSRLRLTYDSDGFVVVEIEDPDGRVGDWSEMVPGWAGDAALHRAVDTLVRQWLERD